MLVRYAPGMLPPLTDAQREYLAQLAALPNAAIDTSDEAWSAGVRGRFA